MDADSKGRLMFQVGGQEAMRFEPNGDIFIQGRKAANDLEVVEGLRRFVREASRGFSDGTLVATGRKGHSFFIAQVGNEWQAAIRNPANVVWLRYAMALKNEQEARTWGMRQLADFDAEEAVN